MTNKLTASAPLLIATIGKVGGLSITALIETMRWSILALPIILSFSQIARAAESNVVTDAIEYEDFIADDYAEPQSPSIARFGPFTVINATLVELIDSIDSDSPEQFRRLLTLYPAITTIRMVECQARLMTKPIYQ